MVSKQVKITNKTGLHLRPAGVLSKIAGGCKSSVILVKGDKRVNAKSVLNVMSAQINVGDEIIVECEGENETDDLQTIIEAIQSGLGE
ncbi:hypothetical protein HMPREF9629_00157 [Peptoanaerobacter stomatis]|uniref:HPr domain-containing protein n=1 Tax=Peptoanaerobacter stomatis TaxID=796937 RepID=G9WXR8_9FIRM|nr:HPr family phosphocarrier protein [Peptoanaerobacter stomatis]EHL16915.1 hypothetical protein HMPREF9629_00157 [Peptoanaerobacter stomatis]